QDGGMEAWGKGTSYVLLLHGAAAMLMLVLLGTLLPFHTVISWRRRENRGMGTVMLAVNAILVVTAFGLYYAGSDTLRRWTSDVHIVVGLSVPLLLAAHVLTGRAAARASRRSRTARHHRALQHDPRCSARAFVAFRVCRSLDEFSKISFVSVMHPQVRQE